MVGNGKPNSCQSTTLKIILPIVLVIIFFVLYFTYNSMKEALITMITVPFALIGGVYMVYFYGKSFGGGGGGFHCLVRYGY
ncbi:MAG: efflux RND transporter permease subunit [Spirosomataceae bacterium]